MDQISDPEIRRPHNTQSPENPFLAAVEGYYSGAILDALHHSGLLEHLKTPCTAQELAVVSSTDVNLLTPLLAYLCGPGRCLSYDPAVKTYCVHASYVNSPMVAHLLDQYIGAYGPCLTALNALLQDPSSGCSLVDRDRHAAAFTKASGAPPDLVDLILRLKPRMVLDLGCGNAGLLRRLVEADTEMSGIGIDMNPAMLKLAQTNTMYGTEDRLQFLAGDVLELAERLPVDRKEAVDLIVAQSLANEFFSDRTIDRFLERLSLAFPNRLLILADYYGCLGNGAPLDVSSQRRGALHDIAQVLSGQGIPPSSLEEWQDIYTRTDCSLLKASSVVSGGLHRFIHVIKV